MIIHTALSIADSSKVKTITVSVNIGVDATIHRQVGSK